MFFSEMKYSKFKTTPIYSGIGEKYEKKNAIFQLSISEFDSVSK